MRRAAITLLPLLTVAASVDTSADNTKALDAALEGRVAAGPAQQCIDSGFTDGPQIIDKRHIAYRSAGRLYLNTLPEECRPLREDSILIVEVHGGQLCRNDLFRTLERGTTIPSGYCRLGDFVLYQKPKPPR